jgi:hypothetical protein
MPSGAKKPSAADNIGTALQGLITSSDVQSEELCAHSAPNEQRQREQDRAGAEIEFGHTTRSSPGATLNCRSVRHCPGVATGHLGRVTETARSTALAPSAQRSMPGKDNRGERS